MRRRFVTAEVREKMRALEAAGKTRAEIAALLNLDRATVTRHLGPVRPYRGLRLSIA